MLSICGELILCDVSSCSEVSVFFILCEVSSFFITKIYGSFFIFFYWKRWYFFFNRSREWGVFLIFGLKRGVGKWEV